MFANAYNVFLPRVINYFFLFIIYQIFFPFPQPRHLQILPFISQVSGHYIFQWGRKFFFFFFNLGKKVWFLFLSFLCLPCFGFKKNLQLFSLHLHSLIVRDFKRFPFSSEVGPIYTRL